MPEHSPQPIPIAAVLDSSQQVLASARAIRLRRLSIEGFWVLTGQAIAVVGSIVGLRLLTSLLDPARYGELALGMTVATLVNQIVLGPLGNGAMRFFAPAQEQSDLRNYLRSVRELVLLAAGVIVLLAAFAAAGLAATHHVELIPLAISVLIFATVSGFNGILNGIQNAARQRSIVALHQGIESWAQYLVAAGLLMWLGTSSTVAVVGYIIAFVLVLGSQSIFFRRLVFPSPTATGTNTTELWRRNIWEYSWPFSVFGIFTFAQLVSDRWALKLFGSADDVGLYAVLFQLGYFPMALASGLAMQFLSPIFYQQAGDGLDQSRNSKVNDLGWRLTFVTLGLTGIAFLVALLLHGPIFHLLVDIKYGSVSYLLPWMLLAGGLFAAGQSLSLNLMSQLKTRALILAKITTALLGIALNIAGAYSFGIAGLVIAAILFSSAYFTWMCMVSPTNRATSTDLR